jgi:ATP-binding cassette subfamily G (WHITE) protein 2
MDIEDNEELTMLKTGEEKQTHGSIISFQSIDYTYPSKECCHIHLTPCLKKKPKQILFNLTGIFKPGMNAILGPTGSGKSTLLDILAYRKDRRGLTGQVLIDGQPQMQDFKYRVGYVGQVDMLSETLTVRENLTFSVNVRLSRNISREAKIAIIDQIIGQLGLEKCANSRVGSENRRGISGGERRRTNIGMELVLSPTVLFLDEPTTGKIIFYIGIYTTETDFEKFTKALEKNRFQK